MKTETEVTVQIKELITTENLFADPEGFMIQVFYSSSRADTRIFKVDAQIFNISQTLKIKNIIGNELQFWLSTPSGKIIAIGSAPLANHGDCAIDLKMVNTDFGKLNVWVEAKTTPIEKQVYIEPDEELLKKVEDPMEKLRLEDEEKRRIRQELEKAEALKAMKKPAITLTQYQKREQPFV